MNVWRPRCWAGIVGGRGVPRDYCFIQSNLSTDNVDRSDMDWIDPLSYPYPIRSEPYLQAYLHTSWMLALTAAGLPRCYQSLKPVSGENAFNADSLPPSDHLYVLSFYCAVGAF